MKVYAFVGVSGSGKSHRAQMIARENNLSYIIDDALLIKGNKIVAGKSAKTASSKITSVKMALFSIPGQKEEIDNYRKKTEIDSILVLGTSDNMVNQIINNIGIGPIEKTIYINEVATKEEIETARNIRLIEGKHVIPVPTFELKKDFSGYLLDPLQIFKKNKNGGRPFMAEKSVIRPTFTYIGNYTISPAVFKQLAEYNAAKSEWIHKVTRVTVDSYTDGIFIHVEVIINYGANIKNVLLELKQQIKRDVEKYTSMNVFDVLLTAKSVNVE